MKLYFPAKQNFANSINKSLSQSLKADESDLFITCFSPWQGNDDCSQFGSGKNVFIYKQQNVTQ